MIPEAENTIALPLKLACPRGVAYLIVFKTMLLAISLNDELLFEANEIDKILRDWHPKDDPNAE